MAKRKQSPAPAAEEHPHAAANGAAIEQDASELSAERLGELAAEVQAFLDRRDELAGKLSLEIELTEKKLAELKRTAALLFPAGHLNGHAEPARLEKKKKVSLAKSARPQEAEAAETAEPKPNAAQTPGIEGAEQAEKMPSENHHAEPPPQEQEAGLGAAEQRGNPA